MAIRLSVESTKITFWHVEKYCRKNFRESVSNPPAPGEARRWEWRKYPSCRNRGRLISETLAVHLDLIPPARENVNGLLNRLFVVAAKDTA